MAILASRIPGAPEPADFAVFYSAAKYLGTLNIYSLPEFARPLQQLGFDPHPFIRLPVYAFLIKPISVLPFDTALLVWRFLTLLACLGFVMLWPGNRLTSAIAVFWSVPLWDALAVGQDISLFLFLTAAILALIQRNRQWSAGILVSACALKFHLFLLFPIFLAGRRLWRTVAAAALGVAFEFGLSSWLMPEWVSGFTQSALSETANAVTHNMFNLRGIFSGVMHPLALEVGFGIALAVACWRLMLRSDASKAIAVMLVGSLMISHHAYLYDAVLCLPLALLMFQKSESETARIFALLVMAPLLYPRAFEPDTNSTQHKPDQFHQHEPSDSVELHDPLGEWTHFTAAHTNANERRHEVKHLQQEENLNNRHSGPFIAVPIWQLQPKISSTPG